MKYLHKPVTEATQESIDEIGKLGGNGGLIALIKTEMSQCLLIPKECTAEQ